jgi:bacteriophage exclusion system BrxA-like protein
MVAATYTTQLQAGLGMLDETRELLDLWEEGVGTTELYKLALNSGRFPSMSARRLRNVVAECFAPRFLADETRPALLLKKVAHSLTGIEFRQVCMVFTCRANAILADFIRDVYWRSYSAGQEGLSNEGARAFVIDANRDGHTASPWSESTVRRVAAYLTGTCADFGLLEPGTKGERRIVPVRLELRAAAIIAYDLYFQSIPDSRLIAADDWSLFGLERPEVIELMQRLSLHKYLIIQTAASSVRIAWQHNTLEEFADAICKR